MISIEQLQDAIQRLYGLNPPNKTLKLYSIRNTIACYLCVSVEQITDVDLKSALRNTDFALPKPKLRTKRGEEPQIDWFFVTKTSTSKIINKKKPREYKEKSIAASLRMKAL